MNRSEFVRKIREKRPAKQYNDRYVELSLSDIDSLLRVICDTIVDELSVGEEIRIEDFGKFYVHKTKDRSGYNPSKNEKISIKSRNIPKFSPFKKFKDEVNLLD